MKALPVKQAIRIVMDRFGRFRQLDLVVRQPPQQWRNAVVNHREFLTEEIRHGREHISGGQYSLGKIFECLDRRLLTFSFNDFG